MYNIFRSSVHLTRPKIPQFCGNKHCSMLRLFIHSCTSFSFDFFIAAVSIKIVLSHKSKTRFSNSSYAANKFKHGKQGKKSTSLCGNIFSTNLNFCSSWALIKNVFKVWIYLFCTRVIHIHERHFDIIYKHVDVLKADGSFVNISFLHCDRVNERVIWQCSCARLRFQSFFSAGVSSVCGTWCRWCGCSWSSCWSVITVAVCAQNLAAVGEEAGAHQRHGAARTLEARLVPLPVLERNVLPISKTCETTHEHIMRANVPKCAKKQYKDKRPSEFGSHHNRTLPAHSACGPKHLNHGLI